MRKIFLSVAALALAIVFFSCPSPALASKPIPPEIKSFIIKFSNQFGDAMEALTKVMDKAKTPEQMASALNSYSDKLEPLMADMATIEAKYPEFFEETDNEDDYYDDEDPDIEKATDRIDQKTEDMMESMVKILSHADHPEVKAALARLGEIMGEEDEEEE